MKAYNLRQKEEGRLPVTGTSGVLVNNVNKH